MSVGRMRQTVLLAAIDALLIAGAALLAFVIRFDSITSSQIKNVVGLAVLSIAVLIPLFIWQGLYRLSFAYVGMIELYQMLKSITFGYLVIVAALFLLREWNVFIGLPRSIVLMQYIILLLALPGLRASMRIKQVILARSSSESKRILVVGAGSTAEQFVRSCIYSSQYCVVGYIETSPKPQGYHIHGIKAIGTLEDIPRVIKKHSIDQIVIALDASERASLTSIVRLCRESHAENVKIVPSHEEIISGSVSISHVRDITIEDLLGRESAKIDIDIVGSFICGTTVLVTGAAGSIGSQLCHEILKFKPNLLIAYDQNETGVFHLERSLRTAYPDARIEALIGSICDSRRLENVFASCSIDTVFHAAAYKHVPLMELHPQEAVKNNAFGTLTLARFASKSHVKTFVFISTDKAIRPTSVMGATKYLGERICHALNSESQTSFCAVRFGNVLDSQGNVVQIFKDRIKRGLPLEITHPDMMRYFMVTSEACLLVLQAGALTKGGETFILDMGSPIKIVDLATEMIRLAGYVPYTDIPIVFTSIRPGEKLFEELMAATEIATKHEKIFITRSETVIDFATLEKDLLELKSLLAHNDNEALRTSLSAIIRTYQQPQSHANNSTSFPLDNTGFEPVTSPM